MLVNGPLVVFFFNCNKMHHLVSLILQTPIFSCKVDLSIAFFPECLALGEVC